MQCVAVCCSVMQCAAVCCSVLQCVAVCCSVLQQKCDLALPNGGLFIVCVYYNMLQCVAAKMLSCECVWVSE